METQKGKERSVQRLCCVSARFSDLNIRVKFNIHTAVKFLWCSGLWQH